MNYEPSITRTERRQRVRSALLLLVLAFTGLWCTAASSQAFMPYYLARDTDTELVFDLLMPQNFSEMISASGPAFQLYQHFPQRSTKVVNGVTHHFITTQIAWTGNIIEEGRLAYAKDGGVEDGSWVTLKNDTPGWPELIPTLKALAEKRDDWSFATLQIHARQYGDEAALRVPIAETVLIQRRIDALVAQTRGGEFYPSVQIPQDIEAVRAQMLAYGNVGRRDPDFRRTHGAKTATDLSGDSVGTLGGNNRVFKQNPTPPWFTDSTLDAQLNAAAQFQAEYNASVNRMSHDGPATYTDRRTGKSGAMRSLGDRAAFFEIGGVVEAAGMGSVRNYPHSWMAGDTHFRPWFSVDGVYPTLGYGAARAADGTWHIVAVATRLADGVFPSGSAGTPPPAAVAPGPAPGASGGSGTETLFSLQSHNFPDRFVRHRDYQGFIDPVVSDLDRKDTTFRQVPGLTAGSQISLEAANFPNFFLVAEGENVVPKQRPPNDPQFDRAATFMMKSGLADPSRLSLESYAQPGSYLRHSNFILYVHPQHPSDLFNQDATFIQAAPGCTGTGYQR